MSIDLWISIGLAIPLAILANLFTPRIQKVLDAKLEATKQKRSQTQKQRREKQHKILKDELAEITKLHDQPELLTQDHLYTLIKVSAYGAIGTIYGFISSFIGEIGHWSGIFGISGRIGAQATALVVGMLVFMSCSRSMKIHRKIRDFDKYKNEVASQLANKD